MEQPVVYVECGADRDHPNPKLRFTRKHYLHPSQVDLFRNHFNNIGVYQTIMHYINPLWYQDERGKWLINAKDSLKYGDFYLDFDTVIQGEEDFQKIREDVSMAIRYLNVILHIDKSQIQFYFSGNKGIHVVVDAKIIGIEPHPALNLIYKEIAKDIEKYCKHKTIDTRVYDDKRMFRMINSINKKSGMYKIPLTYEEIQKLSYQEIINLARQPRFIKFPDPVPSNKAKLAFQKIAEEWTKRINYQKEFSGKLLELKVEPPCIKKMKERTFRETIDERNNSATALTSFYYQQGISREEALYRMKIWGQENCLPPLPNREIETIVNSVYNHHYRYGCETFKRLSGVCDKENCPLFNKELNVEDTEESNQVS
jgi:Primase C terminal 1 (PriCT-1)